MASSSKAKDDTVCPAGYICDFVNETLVQPLSIYSCNQLQEDVKAEGYGDILAGILCKNGTLDEEGAIITNCPAGHYCPDPAGEPIQCRAGFYCPAKSAREDVYVCPGCEAGATRYSINTTPLLVMMILFVALPIALFLALKFQLGHKTFKKRHENKATLRKVQKMKYILKEIDERLGADYVCKLNSDGDIVGFDNDALFDAIDSNGDGCISYEELDKAMALTGVQLKIFIQKMNQASGNPENCTTVSRTCFAKYFFETISAASNFDPSPEDAKDVFESVEETSNTITSNQLYYSSLASFLSEKQIANLIKILRTNLSGSGMQGENIKSSSWALTKQKSMGKFVISKEQFISLYPKALDEMLGKHDEKRQPFDIFFEDLSLTVPVKGGEKVVVNEVSGSLKAATMTALMGGSGAGKTSLLNALCGRAHYGEKKGTIYVNGNESNIEDYTDVIGFVPQDDIVYAELTVRENFLVAGKIRLPRGTKQSYIEDLADDVIADLGLTRVASSIVGDVTRRGVSGGEKKRVNIGLELMSNPSILFLDEPTSGLDASSAMIVMGSLANLVREQEMTVCAVIHQPRKQIYDMFDSLILLGVGGNLVYQGKTTDANNYFERLGYTIGVGEGEADWLIDIASGELFPTLRAPDVSESSVEVSLKDENEKITEKLLQQGGEKGVSAAAYRDRLYKAWITRYTSLEEGENKCFSKPSPTSLPQSEERPSFLSQVTCQLGRQAILARRNILIKFLETLLLVAATIAIAATNKPIQLSKDLDPNIPSEYYVLTSVRENPENFELALPYIFRHAVENANNVIKYGSEISTVFAVLVTLSTAKSLVDKKTEFLREAASGYNINAYFLAVMLFNTAEISIKMILASLFSYAVRNTAASGWNMVVHFVLLGWLSSAWGFLTPFFTSTENVVLVSAFVSLFSTIFLSGQSNGAIKLSDIYRGSPLNAIISGVVAPSRFFIESMSVAEFRTLEIQHGFTNYAVLDEGYSDATGTFLSVGFNTTSMGINDPFIHEESRAGWYWGVLPSILVGLALRLLAFVMLQIQNREQMLMKPISKDRRALKQLFFLLILSGTVLGGSIYLFLTGKDEWALCNVEDPKLLNNNDCDHGEGNYNSRYCKYDNGTCLRRNDILRRYPECDIASKPDYFFYSLGNGDCESPGGEGANIAECGWEDGDCVHPDYPDCVGEGVYLYLLGDGRCDERKETNVLECGWEGGDCVIDDLPGCVGANPSRFQDGYCDAMQNTENCNWDGGDCDSENIELWKKYPDCKGGVYPGNVGDGQCDADPITDSEECGFDGGDCIEFRKKYPNCTVEYIPLLNNTSCDNFNSYNTEECLWDGGDCIEFNKKYPNCTVKFTSELNDTFCDNYEPYNTEECLWDGGDCVVEGYPNCHQVIPERVGDNRCDGRDYNTEECGYDGGDCIEFNEKYPDCDAYLPWRVGDGNCDSYDPYYTAACGWDGGDCSWR